jgi:tripartite-type tricarboxylate transporter receptor subunit TctC
MSACSRRAAVAFLAGVACALASTSRAQAGRPLHILVGYTAGGAVDLLARALGEQLRATLDQPVLIENRPGAGTNLAVRALIDSPPDGQTLLMAANALAANGALFDPPPFDVSRDVMPVAMVGRVPVVIAAGADTKLDTLAGLIAAARSAPRSITYATPGNGSTPHLAMGLFEKTVGVSLLHVPYKGGAQAITDVLGGHVQLVAVNALEVLPHARAGKLKVLAVMSRTRTAVLPDVPTIAESGWPQFEASVWYGLVAPARTPAPVVARLNAAVQQALASPAFKQRLLDAGGEVTPGTPEQFGALIQSERVRYERLIRETGIKPD